MEKIKNIFLKKEFFWRCLWESFSERLTFELRKSVKLIAFPNVTGYNSIYWWLEWNKGRGKKNSLLLLPACWVDLRFTFSVPQSRIYTIGSLGSQDFRLGLNYTTVFLDLHIFFFFFNFLLFRAAPAAYGSSQNRGQTGATATSLLTIATATWDLTCVCSLHNSSWQCWSLIHWARPGIKPVSSWKLVRFIPAAPQWALPGSPHVK